MAKTVQLVKVDKDYRALLRAFNKMDDIANGIRHPAVIDLKIGRLQNKILI